jgi:hypothetical protein
MFGLNPVEMSESQRNSESSDSIQPTGSTERRDNLGVLHLGKAIIVTTTLIKCHGHNSEEPRE